MVFKYKSIRNVYRIIHSQKRKSKFVLKIVIIVSKYRKYICWTQHSSLTDYCKIFGEQIALSHVSNELPGAILK